jgi:Zn-dependent metalloprotease
MRRSTPNVVLVACLALLAAGMTPTPAGASPGGLRLLADRHSLLGIHRWYQQTYDGLPVLGGYLGRHYDRAGRLVGVDDGQLPVTGLAGSRASVAAGTARSNAQRRGAGTARQATLAVLPGARARLVWAVLGSTERGTTRALVDARTGAVLKLERLVKDATGHGRVFDPNPVVTLQDERLTDRGDRDYPALRPAYQNVTLTHLDTSGYLHGDYATIALARAKQAFSPSRNFFYNRTNDRFEQVMAYYDVTVTQAYIHGLGFTDVNNEPQDLLPDAIKVDNSFYDPSVDTITLGTGGVDDAEDAEVTWHEYGHAIQDAQVPGFGANESAGSIGEGFGDYWAFTMSQADSPDTAVTPLACIADWDSTSYTSDVPHCLRRVDTDATMADYDPQGDVHANGEIWSRALHDVNLGLGRARANTVILEAQFTYTPNTSFALAARRTVVTARALFGAGAAATVAAAFHARGVI